MKKDSRDSRNVMSSFGVRNRVGYDSSLFYGRKLYEEYKEEKIPFIENSINEGILDSIIPHSSEVMEELPDNSVHLMVTSPPYNVGKEYDKDLTLGEYVEFLQRVWREVYRVLVPGGRMCVNIANLGRKPYIPLHAILIKSIMEIGFLMRGEIIWDKDSSAGTSTAWGSWMSASNPVLRDTHEYILVFSKGGFKRENPMKRESTITRDEFLEFTKSVWRFPTVSARKIGHPAPFPIELPYRLIQLYTFKGEVVLDPFMGSGQTALACLSTERHFVGYETNQEYVELARKRVHAKKRE